LKSEEVWESVEFASYLTYNPRPQIEEEQRVKDRVLAIKQDKWILQKSGSGSIVRLLCQKLFKDLSSTPILEHFFSGKMQLVPVPTSSLKKEGSLWVPKRICEELQNVGLGLRTIDLLERSEAVVKSATASTGNRPEALKHFETFRINSSCLGDLNKAETILLVDDVCTRGSTFAGAAKRLRTKFPMTEIKCFALVSTRGLGNFRQFYDPAVGRIVSKNNGSKTDRTP